ncbi:protein phosphatase regulator [Paramarasmius palmivorus]|uniref:Protein phosphatase regulator n=1 Tax=Paramarasmius palmivorus TaxID=297713 RepID=A0AAW0D8N7_9AGAR
MNGSDVEKRPRGESPDRQSLGNEKSGNSNQDDGTPVIVSEHLQAAKEGETMYKEKVDSSLVPGPKVATNAEHAIRSVTFWRNGFTIGDGEFLRYDHPNSEAILTEIQNGRAPPSILKVRPGELVELRVHKRTDEDYVPPKKADNAFVPDLKSEKKVEKAVRTMIYWRNGFTVEDSHLMRYDDPYSRMILAEIEAGRAHPSVVKVRPGEPVQLRIHRRTKEDYVPPSRESSQCLIM